MITHENDQFYHIMRLAAEMDRARNADPRKGNFIRSTSFKPELIPSGMKLTITVLDNSKLMSKDFVSRKSKRVLYLDLADRMQDTLEEMHSELDGKW